MFRAAAGGTGGADAMNGFFAYLLRIWLDRARSKLRGTLFGFILLIVFS
jgi:hypothetical protein